MNSRYYFTKDYVTAFGKDYEKSRRDTQLQLLNSTLIEASKYPQDYSSMKDMLELDGDPNVQDRYGNTPIFYACFGPGDYPGSEDYEADSQVYADLLVNYGADLTYVSPNQGCILARFNGSRGHVYEYIKNKIAELMYAAVVGWIPTTEDLYPGEDNDQTYKDMLHTSFECLYDFYTEEDLDNIIQYAKDQY